MTGSEKSIKKVVVVGGGTAGWMSAALLKRVLGQRVDVHLIESSEIGVIGVGEATIPPIQHVNASLGIDEVEFLRETKATVKLAIKFENWTKNGEHYYHTFGVPGVNQGFCSFHHFCARAQDLGQKANLLDYDLNYLLCQENKFAKLKVDNPIWDVPYAYHFDASLYAKFLQKISKPMGVKRTIATVEGVEFVGTSDNIKSLKLNTGKIIEGDLFIDCSGSKGLLIREALNVGYEDWGHLLSCNRAIAAPTKRIHNTNPYTKSIANASGWQWKIPLQHRIGNGFVYSSQYCSDDEAYHIFTNNLDGSPLSDPKLIPFTTGRTKEQWKGNVVAVGLSSGFLEPLESTGLYMIQSAIVRLLNMFPYQKIEPEIVAEYNLQSKFEFETVRDFIILHYYLNQRRSDKFWNDARNVELPDRLATKIKQFEATGYVVQENLDIFLEPSWVQVMLGQGLIPKSYHPVAAGFDDKAVSEFLEKVKTVKVEPLAHFPDHDEYLKKIGGLAT